MPTEAQTITAAELALGLLDPEETWTAERRMREDPELMAEVGYWEDRFARALDGSEDLAPPRDLLPDIQATLFGVEEARDARPATRSFPWGKLILGVIAFKAVLLSAFFYLRAAATETYQVDSQYGQSVLNWNARTGQIKLTGNGAGDLGLWLRSGSRFNYLGPGGETLSAGLAAGAVVIISGSAPGSSEPDVIGRIVLTRH